MPLITCMLFLAEPSPKPIILDTDIGSDVDDCFAIATAIQHPGLTVVAITTVHDPDGVRARLARKLLAHYGRRDMPIYAGRRKPGPPPSYSYGQWVDGFRWTPPSETGPEAIVRLVNERPGKLTLVAVGPQTNVADALVLDPDLPRKLKGFVCMAGSLRIGYGGSPTPHAEWNITQDIESAKRVFASELRPTMVGLDVCGLLIPDEAQMRRLNGSRNLGSRALARLARMYGDHGGPYPPVLYDVMAILQAADPTTCRTEALPMLVDAEGFTVESPDGKLADVCVEADLMAACTEAWRILGL